MLGTQPPPSSSFLASAEALKPSRAWHGLQADDGVMLQGKVDEYEAAFQSVDTSRSGTQQQLAAFFCYLVVVAAAHT